MKENLNINYSHLALVLQAKAKEGLPIPTYRFNFNPPTASVQSHPELFVKRNLKNNYGR